MKCLLLLSLFVFDILLLQAQKKQLPNQFTIKGKITGLDSGFVHLKYNNSKGEWIHDSSRIVHGTFLFSGSIKEPVIADFYGNRKSRGDESNSAEFYLEPGLIQITVTESAFKQAQITGSYTQTEYEEYNHRMDELEHSWKSMWDSLNRAKTENDTDVLNTLYDKRLPKYRLKTDELIRGFIKEHSSSYVSADLLFGQSFHAPVDTIKGYYNVLSSPMQRSAVGQRINEFIIKEENIAIGHAAPQFSATDANGNAISLHNYKGKFVLLDFWASWCEPCREEHPFLKDVYAKYHQQGFDIIEVSLDKKGYEDDWKQAILKDGLPWTQICDFKAWDNDIIKLYNVWGKGIPANFLIDPQGKIIDKNLPGDEIEKRISMLIK